MKSLVFLSLLLLVNTTWALESRTNEIEKYSPQTDAVTIVSLCNVIQSGKIDWGKKTKIECLKNSDGTIQLRAINATSSLSVNANPSDKTVYEAFGFDDIHQYKNDRDESFKITFNFVTAGTKKLSDGTLIKGSYRGDAVLKSGSHGIRVGFYSN